MFDAVAGVGVGFEEFRAATATALRLQDLHHFDQAFRVVAGIDHEAHAEVIRLVFVLAAVAGRFDLVDQAGDLLRIHVQVGPGHAGGLGEAGPQLGFGHLFGGVAADDMADFVAEYAGHLVLGLEVLEQSVGEEDLASGQGESIDHFRVAEQVEIEPVFPELFGPCSLGIGGHQFGAHLVDEGIELRVRVFATALLGHLPDRLQPHGDFLLSRHRHPLRLAGHRVVFDLGLHEVADHGESSHGQRDHQAGRQGASAARHGSAHRQLSAAAAPGVTGKRIDIGHGMDGEIGA